MSYELNISTADGENGYYLRAPEIWVQSTQPGQMMRYQLRSASGWKIKGIVGEERINIGRQIPGDGSYYLDLWLEDQDGTMISGTESSRHFVVDSGIDTDALKIMWDASNRKIQVVAKDSLSGVDGIYYKIGSESEVFFEGNTLYLNIPSAFEGRVGVRVRDCAGNQGVSFYSEEIRPQVKKEESKISANPVPDNETKEEIRQLHVSCDSDCKITNQNVTFSCDVKNPSDKETFVVDIRWEDIEGEAHEEQLSAYPIQRTFSEEGTYRICVQAGELTKECRFIIDKTPPVIEHLTELEGKKVQSFQWRYDIEQFVHDYSSYEYQVQVKNDGEILQLHVSDAAGNVSEQEVILSAGVPDTKDTQQVYVGHLMFVAVLLLCGETCKRIISRIRKRPSKTTGN